MTSYLVCHQHIGKVKKFLSNFLSLKDDGANHSGWITFKVPEVRFWINLMSGDTQHLTQNFTLEIQCKTMKELKQLATKHKKKIHSFKSTKSKKAYMFYYISIVGPAGICKVEASFSENL